MQQFDDRREFFRFYFAGEFILQNAVREIPDLIGVGIALR